MNERAGASAGKKSRRWARYLGAIAVGYAAVCVLLFFFQRRLLYMPTKLPERTAIAEAARWELAPWRDAAGKFLGWRRPTKRGGPAILMLHGNASHAVPRGVYAEGLESADRSWNVYLVEYPGYGCRPGDPTRDSLVACALEAVAEVEKEHAGNIFLLGESMGSGVACAVVEKMPTRIAGVLLTVPFAQLSETAASHYPILPVKWLLADEFDNVRALANYRGPLAVLLAGRDEVVPTAHGQRLFESYQGPKKLWIQPSATHNEVDLSPNAEFWKGASEFLRANGQ
jgi:hypothetical protein